MGDWKKLARWTPLIAWLLIAVANWPWMNSLGVEHDEALFWPAAVELVHGSTQRIHLPDGVEIAGRPLRFQLSPYIGALNSYVYAVPVAIFGPSPLTFRCVNVLLLLAVLAAAYALAEALSGPVAGMLTVAMLAVDLELILMGITNQGPFLLQLLGTAIAVRAGLRWPAAIGIAIALNEKLTYIWIIALLASGGLLLYRPKLRRQAWITAALLALLMIPMAIYMVGWARVVGQFVQSNTSAPADLGAVAIHRLSTLYDLLAGQVTMHIRVGSAGVSRFSALPWLIAGGLLAGLWQRDRFAILCVWVGAGLLVFNIVATDGGRLHHLILMYPLVQCGAASAITKLPKGPLVAALLLAATGFSTWQNIAWFNNAARSTGGAGHWSRASLELAAWQREHPSTHVVYATWGLERVAYAVNSGAHKHVELYFDLLADPWSTRMTSEVRRHLQRRENVWVFSYVEERYRTIEARILSEAAALGLQPRTVHSGATYVVRSFVPDEPAVPNMRDVPFAPHIRLPLPEGVGRIRITAKPPGPASVLIEFHDAAGNTVEQHFRPTEHFPIRTSETWEFGRHLYPDAFLH